MRKTQSGFTLIELVVVLAVIAVLAAIALPRFANLQGQARIAKMNGALGSIKSAAVMSHALLIANGYSASATGDPGSAGLAGTDINVEGVNAVYTNGYPTAATIPLLAGIGAPADTVGATTALGDYYVVNVTGGVLTLAPDINHTSCVITYTESAAANAPPTYNFAALTVDNCS